MTVLTRFLNAGLPAIALAAFAVGRPAPVTAQDSNADSLKHEADVADAQAVIAKFKEKDPGMAEIFDKAAGYAVYPGVTKAGVGVGGARGGGTVYQNGKLIGRSKLTQVSVGLQLGGQVYSEVVFFHNQEALDNFKKGHLKLDAQASAVALKERASVDLPYRNGVAIVTMAKGGLMYEATVGGQKFSFDPIESS
jgi:lipid-binding SYLF domain-containing protein